MPLIQGGPPEWIWERPPNLLKWEMVLSEPANGHPVWELRANCGLEIMRLHFFTEDQIKELRAVIDQTFGERTGNGESERVRPGQEPGISPEKEPGNNPAIPDAERPPPRREGTVSDPDPAGKH